MSGVDIRWFPVDGFDTCWIPRSLSCGSSSVRVHLDVTVNILGGKKSYDWE